MNWIQITGIALSITGIVGLLIIFAMSTIERKGKENMKKDEKDRILRNTQEIYNQLQLGYLSQKEQIDTLITKVANMEDHVGNIRRDVDELKGNYQHNVTPILEVARDNIISNNQDISDIEDRLDAIEEMTGLSPTPLSLDDIVEPVPDIVAPGIEPIQAMNIKRDLVDWVNDHFDYEKLLYEALQSSDYSEDEKTAVMNAMKNHP